MTFFFDGLPSGGQSAALSPGAAARGALSGDSPAAVGRPAGPAAFFGLQRGVVSGTLPTELGRLTELGSSHGTCETHIHDHVSDTMLA